MLWTLRAVSWILRAIMWTLRAVPWILRAMLWTLRASLVTCSEGLKHRSACSAEASTRVVVAAGSWQVRR
eukprot:3264640-Pyramimonas_sp.AAC.1